MRTNLTKKDIIEIEIKAQSFLQNQVRSMVGCLKYVGENKWSIQKFDKIIKSKKSTAALSNTRNFRLLKQREEAAKKATKTTA